MHIIFKSIYIRESTRNLCLNKITLAETDLMVGILESVILKPPGNASGGKVS